MSKEYAMPILTVYDNDGNEIAVPAIAGKSAYQYAVANGYTGTEAEFAAAVNPDNFASSKLVRVVDQTFSAGEKAIARENIGAAEEEVVEQLSKNVAYINETQNETVTNPDIVVDGITVDGSLSTTSTNPVQNKVVTQEMNVLSARMDTFTELEEGSTTGDAELTDIRVGYDGTTYPTAGDAVRGQVNQLSEEIDYLYEKEELPMTYGYYVSSKTPPVNSVDIKTSEAGYSYAWVECKESERFTVNCELTIDSPLCPYIFIDDSGNIVSSGQKGLSLLNQKIITPSDATHLIINTLNNLKSYRNIDVSARVSVIESELDKATTITELPMTYGYYVSSETPPVNSVDIKTSEAGYSYAWIECKEGYEFILNTNTGGNAASYMFLDNNGDIIEKSAGGISLTEHKVIAPSGATQLIVNTKNDLKSFHVKTIAERVSVIESELDKAIGKIDDISGIKMDYTKNGYYVSMSKETVAIKNSTSGYSYIEQSCKESDLFIINATVSGTVRAYCFVDIDNNIIYRSEAGANADTEIVTAPKNASKLYINDKGGNESFYFDESVMKYVLSTITEFYQKQEEQPAQSTGRDAFGGYNAAMRGKQISDITYTPVVDMEKQVNGYSGWRNVETVPAGTECNGILYSSAQHNGGQLCIDVSLYTFLSAIQNPNSKVYTFEGIDYNGFLWYGSVCTGLVCHALGIPEKYPTTYFVSDIHPDFVKVDAYDVRIGDVMAKTGHVRLVTMVEHDAYGRITSVEITESVHSFARTVKKSFATYISEIDNDGYHIVRYKKLGSVEYEPDGCVIMDGETTSPPTFPDILSDCGDKCVIHEGDDIAFTIMKSDGYTSIEIYKDGTKIETKNSVENFIMNDVPAGSYEIKLVGDSKASSCYFIAIDCVASYENNTVTFESVYGKLQTVTSHKTRTINENGVYNGQTAAYGAVVFDNPQNSGTVDITYALEHAGGQTIGTGDYICLHMMCEYGRVEFKVVI